MPIYEYRCQACQHQFEEIQAFSDVPLKKCPECGKPKLEKLISSPSFQLKGSGWYATDFKNSAKPAKSEVVSATESKPEAKSDKTSETKATDSGTSTKEKSSD